MRRIVKILGFAMVLTALIVVSIAGAAFAAGGNTTDNGNQGEECPYSDCDPNFNNWDYNYESPGPHGAQTGAAFTAGVNTDNGNQGEECLYSDCDPNNWDYHSPGPHGNGKVS